MFQQAFMILFNYLSSTVEQVNESKSYLLDSIRTDTSELLQKF
jgi:hypothetical protein